LLLPSGFAWGSLLLIYSFFGFDGGCYRPLRREYFRLYSLNDNLKSYFQEMQYQDKQPPNYTTNGADEYGEKVYDNRRYKD
jgi:hypothetical protein